MPKDNVSRLPSGGVLLQKQAAAVRRFSILVSGATDGARVMLSPVQLAGVSPLEATGILSQVKIGAPAQDAPPVSEEVAGSEPGV